VGYLTESMDCVALFLAVSRRISVGCRRILVGSLSLPLSLSLPFSPPPPNLLNYIAIPTSREHSQFSIEI